MRRIFSSKLSQMRSFMDAPAWVDSLRDAQNADRNANVSYDIQIDDDLTFTAEPFRFDEKLFRHLSETYKNAFTNHEPDKKYICIGSAFAFADYNDNPVVNDPSHEAKLYWDPSSPTEKVLVQISPYVPPSLWIPIKPSHEALKRLFRDFVTVDAMQLERYMGIYDKQQVQFEEEAKTTLAESANVRAMNHFKDQLRYGDVSELRADYPLSTTLYCGTVSHPSEVHASILNDPVNPFFFSWPMLQYSEVDVTTPKFSAFRSVFSKAQVIFITRMDLSPDNESPEGLAVCSESPLFAHIIYPDMPRFSGGANIVNRFNQNFGCDFPKGLGVDILAGLAEFQPQGIEKLQTKWDRMCEVVPTLLFNDRHHVNDMATCLTALSQLGDPNLSAKVAYVLEERTEKQLRLAAVMCLRLSGNMVAYDAAKNAESDPEVLEAIARHEARMGTFTGAFTLQEHTLDSASSVKNPTFDADSAEEIAAAEKLKKELGGPFE